MKPLIFTLTFMLAFCFQSLANAMETHELSRHGSWISVLDIESDGSFHCSIDTYISNATFHFSVDSQGDYVIYGIVDDRVSKEGTTFVDVKLVIDGSVWTLNSVRIENTENNSIFWSFYFKNTAQIREFIHEFSRGRSLVLDPSGANVLFPLSGSRSAIQAMDECFYKIRGTPS